MITREFSNSSGKKLAQVYSFLDLSQDISDDDLIKNILEQIPKLDSCGYGGYLEKKYLENSLSESIFSPEGRVSSELNNSEEIFEVIERVLNKCSFVLKDKLNIFLFPNFDSFVKEKMFGNTGYTPWENTIHLYINFINKEKIAHSLAHEIAHAVSRYSLDENKIGAALLYEGIAEFFREDVIGGEIAPWSNAISKDVSKKILENIDVEEINFELYNELFFGSEKYPMWSGYTVGYLLVKNMLDKAEEIEWEKLLRKNMNNMDNFPKI